MTKTFKYRIYPTKEQISILNTTLELCKDLYNNALDRDYNASCNILRLGTNQFSINTNTEKLIGFSHE
jgi:transposase